MSNQENLTLVKACDLKAGDTINYSSIELLGGGRCSKPIPLSGTISEVKVRDSSTIIYLEMGRILRYSSEKVIEVNHEEKNFRESAMVSSIGKPTTFKGVSIE